MEPSADTNQDGEQAAGSETPEEGSTVVGATDEPGDPFGDAMDADFPTDEPISEP